MPFKSFFNSLSGIISQSQLERRSGASLDKKSVIILFFVPVSLLLVEYLGKSPGSFLLRELFRSVGFFKADQLLKFYLETSANASLYKLIYWVSIIFFAYFIIPVFLIRLVFKEKLSNYGLQWGSFWKDSWLYLLMLAIMIPLVYFASRTESFQYRYPFYSPSINESLWPNFWIWQFVYLLQFFALEFFFRGFMVHGLKRELGIYSIFVMTIPYCMIHFGKPMSETFAAIFAGLALGLMSLKSRSIALGVFLHYSVAITMDFAALWHEGYFR